MIALSCFATAVIPQRRTAGCREWIRRETCTNTASASGVSKDFDSPLVVDQASSPSSSERSKVSAARSQAAALVDAEKVFGSGSGSGGLPLSRRDRTVSDF